MFRERITRQSISAAIAATAFVGVGATPSSAANPIEQEIIQNRIQLILSSTRDQIRQRLGLGSAPGMTRFTAEESEFDNQHPFEASAKHAFDALAYAKAPAAAVAVTPTWIYGINAIGGGDETRTGMVSTTTASGTGAFDVTKIGIFTASDALTFVATGTGIHAHTFGLEFNTGSGAGTLAYTNGGFSADFTTAASWSHGNALNLGIIAPPDSSMVSYTGNVQYRYDLQYGAFIEPTIGVTYTEIYTANFGTRTGDSTELHAGGRIGTEMKWMGFTVQPQLSGAVFKNVTQSGVIAGAVPGGPPIVVATAADSGLGGRGSGRINVIWTQNFSSFLEAHGSGVAGTKTVGYVATQTIGASGGLRWTW